MDYHDARFLYEDPYHPFIMFTYTVGLLKEEIAASATTNNTYTTADDNSTYTTVDNNSSTATTNNTSATADDNASTSVDDDEDDEDYVEGNVAKDASVVEDVKNGIISEIQDLSMEQLTKLSKQLKDMKLNCPGEQNNKRKKCF